MEASIERGTALFPHDAAAIEAERAARRRRVAIGVAAVLVVIGALIALAVLRGGRATAPPAPAVPRVTVVVPGRQPIASTVSATGTIAARREMPVGIAGEGGMVSAVLVEPGDRVAAGQALATIERSVQSEQANALAASIGVARADAALAEADLKRAQALIGRGFVSKADIDRRTATRDAAVARVSVARAQFDEARARIGRLVIRAPAAGLVLTRAVEPGQIVGAAGGGPLFRIAKGGELELLARVAEQDLARLRVGGGAEVTPVGASRTFAGRIWQLSPTIDAQTRQGVARVALGYDPALRPGGFAAVRIGAGTVDAPLLPESAVLSDSRGSFVYVVDPANRIVRRSIKIGEVDDRGVSIVSGLAGTERVVYSAGAFLTAGDTVEPVPLRKPGGK